MPSVENSTAVDALEGSRLTSLGQPNALSVVALAERGSMFDPGPCVGGVCLTANTNQLSVISQPENVKFGLAAVFGVTDIDVRGEATDASVARRLMDARLEEPANAELYDPNTERWSVVTGTASVEPTRQT